MLRYKEVKSVLNKLKHRDSWFHVDYSVNPYEGCSCNCLYCYIRGSKYGENMAERLSVKSNALEILDKQLTNRAKKDQYGIIALGSATDAYIHQEEQEQLSRGMLELILKHRFPVFISTKRELIIRDIDLLKQIDQQAILPSDLQPTLKRGVILSVSVSTLDKKIADILEPGAIPALQRLQLVSRLKSEGFLCGVNAIPLLPYISDTEEEMEKVIKAVKNCGADYILAGGLTLFGNEQADSKTLYFKFLERYDPNLIPAYQDLYREQSYTSRDYQNLLKSRVDKLCLKYQIRNKILD